MALTVFQRGALIGALVTAGLIVLAAAGAAAVLIVDWDVEEPPDPTATRYQVRGEVLSYSGQRVCMSDEDTESQESMVEVCGLILSEPAGVLAVGDDVVGDAVEIELDPGSGAEWRIWAYIGPEP